MAVDVYTSILHQWLQHYYIHISFKHLRGTEFVVGFHLY